MYNIKCLQDAVDRKIKQTKMFFSPSSWKHSLNKRFNIYQPTVDKHEFTKADR